MPLNTEQFKYAIELAAPTLAAAGLLTGATSESSAVAVIQNAYRVVVAAQQDLSKRGL